MTLLLGVDTRTVEGKRLKPLIGPVAVSLRESGWTTVQIGQEIGVSPASVSMYLWEAGAHRLRTTYETERYEAACRRMERLRYERDEFEAWREQRKRENVLDNERWEVEKLLLGRVREDWADVRQVAREAIVYRTARLRAERRHMRQLRVARQRRMRELIRTARRRRRQLEQAREAAEGWLLRDRVWIWNEARATARANLAQERREQRQRESAGRRYRWRATKPKEFSLDAPLLDGDASWHDFLVGVNDAADPARLYEEEERRDALASVLGDLQIEDIGRLNDWDLEHLRTRLRDEELVSFRITAEERHRTRPVVPKRLRVPRRGPNATEVAESLGGRDDRRPMEDAYPWETRNQRRIRRQREDRAERDREAA